ncbi:MAG TPA: hypothetical protein VGI99_06850 [Gemmataceae bacterium]|jgi:hypothetical protein
MKWLARIVVLPMALALVVGCGSAKPTGEAKKIDSGSIQSGGKAGMTAAPPPPPPPPPPGQ